MEWIPAIIVVLVGTLLMSAIVFILHKKITKRPVVKFIPSFLLLALVLFFFLRSQDSSLGWGGLVMIILMLLSAGMFLGTTAVAIALEIALRRKKQSKEE